MTIAIYITLFLLSCGVLIKGGSLLVNGLIKVANFFHLSEFVVAFVLIAIGTSLPELFVGVRAALGCVPVFSLGNIIGSNIANLTLIIGLPVILARGIKIKSKIVYEDALYMLVVALLPILLLLDKKLSRVDGCILMLVFTLYVFNLFPLPQKRGGILYKFSKGLNNLFFLLHLRRKEEGIEKGGTEEISDHISRKDVFKNFLLCAGGLILLLVGAEGAVRFASLLAQEMLIPLILIGLVITPIGTALPELTFGLKAVKVARHEMILGNLIGSVVANSALVLGIVALIHPIVIENFALFLVSGVFLVISLLIFVIFIRTKEELSWQEGMILVLLFIGFIIAEMIAKG